MTFFLKTTLIVAFTSTFVGCTSRISRPIVFGLYDVPPNAFAEVQEAGFDVVVGTPDLKLMRAAREAKIKLLMHTSALRKPVTQTSIAAELQSYDRDPAAWGWYLVDEPDMHDMPPRRIDRATRQFQLHALKPGVVVVASGSGAKSHGTEANILFADFYPVPWSPVARFAKEMRLVALARDNKPFMSVVQAFDWSHFSDVLGQTNGLRAPTINEIRCMSYMALAMGTKGLFYYSYNARTWNLSESSLWPELKSLVKELRINSALFEDVSLWWPTEIDYPDPKQMYNEVHESAILARLYRLGKPSAGHPTGYYFLLINTTADSVAFDFKLPFEPTEKIHQVGENVDLSLEGNWLRRTYLPYEVIILGPIRSSPNFEN